MKKIKRNIKASIWLNSFVVVATIFSTISLILTYEDSIISEIATSGWCWFRFYTVDSNILAALFCLPVLWFAIKKKEVPKWAGILKFIGTVTVMITFIATMGFLSFTFGIIKMLKDEGIFVHLICPLFCMISMFFFDGISKLKFRESLLGLLPIAVYSIVYILAVLVFGIWTDFYELNTSGHGYIAGIIVAVVSFGMDYLLYRVHNRLRGDKKEKNN